VVRPHPQAATNKSLAQSNKPRTAKANKTALQQRPFARLAKLANGHACVFEKACLSCPKLSRRNNVLKNVLAGFREVRTLNAEFTVLFQLAEMDFGTLSGRLQSHLRQNALCYGSKQTFIAALPAFVEHGLLKNRCDRG
jgi:hypothetical protein